MLSNSADHWILADRRGQILLPAFWDKLSNECPEVEGLERTDEAIEGSVKAAEGYFREVRRRRFYDIIGSFVVGG